MQGEDLWPAGAKRQTAEAKDDGIDIDQTRPMTPMSHVPRRRVPSLATGWIVSLASPMGLGAECRRDQVVAVKTAATTFRASPLPMHVENVKATMVVVVAERWSQKSREARMAVLSCLSIRVPGASREDNFPGTREVRARVLKRRGGRPGPRPSADSTPDDEEDENSTHLYRGMLCCPASSASQPCCPLYVAIDNEGRAPGQTLGIFRRRCTGYTVECRFALPLSVRWRLSVITAALSMLWSQHRQPK